ncbi:MAG: 2-dehydro-3-deoxygalactonokinase [Pseudomonadota bacterium]
MSEISWIAADWGTSNLRVWALSDDDAVQDQAENNQGMAKLAPGSFEKALREIIAPWHAKTLNVLACGMVGARQGWVEAPYAQVPCKPDGTEPVAVTTSASDLRVSVLPGLKQVKHPDVMRGEETQIAGFLRLNPNWDGVVCLPGTHSKWVHVSAGEVVSFRTFLSGELFALLAYDSVLKHSVDTKDFDKEAFLSAVSDTLSKPAIFAAKLFELRASHLLNDTEASVSRSRLSGLIIGSEIAAAKPYWLGQQVALIGAPYICGYYAEALSTLSVPTRSEDAGQMTLSGLIAARHAHNLF